MFLLNILFLVIFILVLAGWISAIFMLIQVGESKGYDMSKSGMLWFMGIFASPIVLGLYICALPNKQIASENTALTPESAPANEDLPSI